MTLDVPRGYAKGRAKRQQIVEEATALFGEVGYRSASLREIATRCGMSHPGLLHHFPSKEHLLRAVLEHRDAVDAERYTLVDGSGTDRLGRFVDLVAHNADVPGLVELFATLAAEASAPDHPAHAYFVERYERTRGSLTGVFRAVAAEGRLAPGTDPAHLAVTTVAVTDGLQVQWLLDRGSVDMAAAVSRYLATVVVGWDPAAR
jgi:AcrR family transcriptional regulator